MSKGRRYTAGYLGALHPEMLPGEREAVIAWNEDEEPDRWFVDLEDGRAEFKALIAEIAECRVHRVVLRDRHALPDDTALTGEFFDVLMQTDTELHYVEHGTTNATEKLLAQLVPLLHEWNAGEIESMAANGWYTIHAGREDVSWLRAFLSRSDTPEAARWLERLLPDIATRPEGPTRQRDDG